MTTGTTPTSRRIAIPNQHGAWAFLLVPLLLGFLVAGWSWSQGLFAVAWVLAYPASYYPGPRGRHPLATWHVVAVGQELRDGLPWILMAAVPAVAARPCGRGCCGWVRCWQACGRWCVATDRSRTRASNDLLLVAQAAVAVPLMWGIATNTANLGIADPAATDAWLAAFICLVFFTGSVLHVKSLIREADDRRWRSHPASSTWQPWRWTFDLWWLLLPFGVAAVRRSVPAGVGQP